MEILEAMSDMFLYSSIFKAKKDCLNILRTRVEENTKRRPK